MADAVTTQKIHDGDRQAVFKFTNISDGTGEAAVVKIDVSTLQAESRTNRPCTSVAISRIYYDLSGMSVDVLWDVSFTTTGAALDDRYFVMLVVDKKYV